MKRLVLAAIAVLTLFATQSAVAADSKFKVYGMLAYVSPLSESDEDISGVTEAVKASSEMGYNFGLEFRMSPLLGIELDYLYAEQDLEGDTAGLLGTTTFQPISGTLNLHFPVGNLDLYGGPTVAYVNWGDLEVPSGPSIEIEPDYSFGISAGADINLTSNIAATGGLRWLNVAAEGEDSDDAVDVNPLFARIGVAFRF